MSNNQAVEQSLDEINTFNNVMDPNESYTPPLPTSNEQRPASPENCPICIHPCVVYSTTDVCLHRFCFECIKKWARVKNECPLCKKRFRAIRHNYQSENVYSVYNVSNVRGGQLLTDSFLDQLNFPIDQHDFLSIDYLPRYVYSTTFRVNESEQQTLNEYFLQNPSIRFVDFNVGGTQSTGHVHRVYNRYSSVSTTSFRRSIYLFNWWAIPFEGSVANVSVQDYIGNPDYEEKLRPWMSRETIALLGGDIPLQSRFLDDIYSALRQHSVMTLEFLTLVEQYLQHRTYHFAHELYVFLRSRLDLQTYDTRIRFTDSPREVLREMTSIYQQHVNNEERPTRTVTLRSPIRIEVPTPEVIVIDSDSDSEIEQTPRSRNRRIDFFRGFRRRLDDNNSGPVEVIELLSDSDSDSNSSISTTSIHYRTSSTLESMRTPGTSSCDSPILIESSSDEMEPDNTVSEIGDIISIDLDANTFTTTTTISTSGISGAGITTTTEATANLLEITEPESTSLSTFITMPPSASSTSTQTLSNVKPELTSNISTVNNDCVTYCCTPSTSQDFHGSNTWLYKREMLIPPSTSPDSIEATSSSNCLLITQPVSSPPSSSSLTTFSSSSSCLSSSSSSSSLSSTSSSSSSSSSTTQSRINKRKRKYRKNTCTKRRKASRK